MLNNNILALLITFGAAVIWLRINNFAAQKGWLSSHTSRKIIHMGTGPIFVLCWLLFPGKQLDRFLAALVPGLNTIQFTLVGSGIIKDDAAVQSMSRSGNPKELLRGPLFYGIVFILLTTAYWFDTPIGIIGLMLMCGGDGLAELVGRRFGVKTLPWSASKTWVGSFGMFLGGWSFAMGITAIYLTLGYFSGPISQYILPITLITLLGTIVESFPLKDIDNITVTLTALLLGHIFF